MWGSPSGPLDAPLVVVARDFGWQEEKAGVPLVGPSGKLLTRAMADAGVARSTALLTNVANIRPPGDRWEAHAPGSVARGVEELHMLLGAAPRRLIVTLGEQALAAVTRGDPNALRGADDGITELRGYGRESAYGPVLALVHPAFIIRNWHPWWATFCWDWQKAARWLAQGRDSTPRTERWVRDADDLAAFVAKARRARLLAFDTETRGEGEATEVLCVAFAFDSREGVCVPVSDWTRPAIAELLGSEAPKAAHNAQFDMTVCEREGWAVANVAEDTMLKWHSTEPLLAGKREGKASQRTEKSLRFLASLLTDEPWWKEYNFRSPEERWLLCAKDARVTLRVSEKLEERMQSRIEVRAA